MNMNTKQILYYANALIRKLDLSADAFIERIEALRQGDKDRVEYIEKMMLKPLSHQIKYLATRATVLTKRRKNERQN
tara:strand:+ start:133 stop:363 length:231 start_codon:yes stop_codon:yes gene_type:complete